MYCWLWDRLRTCNLEKFKQNTIFEFKMNIPIVEIWIFSRITQITRHTSHTLCYSDGIFIHVFRFLNNNAIIFSPDFTRKDFTTYLETATFVARLDSGRRGREGAVQGVAGETSGGAGRGGVAGGRGVCLERGRGEQCPPHLERKSSSWLLGDHDKQ